MEIVTDRAPAVGDRAIIYSREMVVTAASADLVEFSDPDRVAVLQAIADMREAGQPYLDAVAAARARVRADAQDAEARAELAALESAGPPEGVVLDSEGYLALPEPKGDGTKVRATPDKLRWVGEDDAWTITGRLLSVEHQQRWGILTGQKRRGGDPQKPAPDAHVDARAFLRFRGEEV